MKKIDKQSDKCNRGTKFRKVAFGVHGPESSIHCLGTQWTDCIFLDIQPLPWTIQQFKYSFWCITLWHSLAIVPDTALKSRFFWEINSPSLLPLNNMQIWQVSVIHQAMSMYCLMLWDSFFFVALIGENRMTATVATCSPPTVRDDTFCDKNGLWRFV